MNYVVKVPIAGHVFVTVKDAKSRDEAKEKALYRCCDFNNEDVLLDEISGYEKLVEGNVCYSACFEMDIIDEYEDDE